jgi:dTDP-glucose 4,6-dehydratase
MIKMVKVLVTGGAGFIGGNFTRYMLEKYSNYEIYNLDALTYASDLTKFDKLANNPNYHFIRENIANREAIDALFKQEQFDFVVHFAAESHVDRSIKDPDIFIHTNVLGTQVLLDKAKQYHVKRFIHISTDEVYGELELDSPALFTEDTPLQPNSPYSASKASSDLLARSYFQTYCLPIITTRCSNNYGPYQYPEKLIPQTIARILKNKRVPVYGTGENVRDWLHVYDHCSAIDLILHKGKIGEVYNVGGNNEKTNIEVVSKIIELLGVSDDLIEFVDDRLGHDKRYAIDSTKLQQLGWQPYYSFDIGLKQTIDWYKKNEDFLTIGED